MAMAHNWLDQAILHWLHWNHLPSWNWIPAPRFGPWNSCTTTIAHSRSKRIVWRTRHLQLGTNQIHLAHETLARRPWPIFSLQANHMRDTSHLIGSQPCIYGPFWIADWKLGALGYKRYACPTCVPHNYCLHPHKYLCHVLQCHFSERSVGMCVYYWFSNGLLTLVTWKIMFQFARNPLIALDNDLKDALAFAWSLPPHHTFERKMASIQAAIDEAAASSPWDYPRCHIFNFVCKIGEAVRVSLRISKPFHLS